MSTQEDDMVPVTQAQIAQLAPHCLVGFKQAFASADTVLTPYGINDSARRLAHFMAQVLHETGGLTIQSENLNYSAERLMAVWPKRFPNLDAATPYARNPEKLANLVYGGRMGNIDPGDGYKYIGRGLLQITGRASYKKFGDLLGIDLAGTPALAVDPQWALKVACEVWKWLGCNAKADADDIVAVTKAINGGLTGLADRQAWLVKTKAVWS
jgi:putative chitinase